LDYSELPNIKEELNRPNLNSNSTGFATDIPDEELLNEMENSHWCNGEGTFLFDFKERTIKYHDWGSEKELTIPIESIGSDNFDGERRVYLKRAGGLDVFGVKNHVLLLHLTSKETAKLYKCNKYSAEGDSGYFIQPVTEIPLLDKFFNKTGWCGERGEYNFGTNFFFWAPYVGKGCICPYNYVFTEGDRVNIIYKNETAKLIFSPKGDSLLQYMPDKKRPSVLRVCKSKN
jgi:hypothetical protein